MNFEITKVVDWLRINKLSLNIKKTHFIIFRRKRGHVHLLSDLKINNVKINMVEKTKFLGVIIDPFLTFASHIQYIKGKIARGVGILCKTRKFFDRNTMVTLYNAFIYPYFNYCNAIWGNTHKCHLDALIKLQKRAIRLISGANKLAHTAPLFQELKILNLQKIFVYSVQIFMFKSHHALLPDSFSNFFVRNSDVYAYYTRQHSSLHVPLSRSTQATKSIRTMGVSIYNYFLRIIDLNCSMATYKWKLRSHLMTADICALL